MNCVESSSTKCNEICNILLTNGPLLVKNLATIKIMRISYGNQVYLIKLPFTHIIMQNFYRQARLNLPVTTSLFHFRLT